MKLLVYIWRNASRNRLRSILTVLSVGFSLALTTILYGYLAMNEAWGKAAAPHNRIVVLNTQGFSGKLPLAYVDRVRQTDGVLAAVPFSWFGGRYNNKQATFAQFGTDAEHVFDVWPEYDIDPAQIQAWQDDRQGCVVDSRLAQQQGWQLGDRIPLQGEIYPFDLDLKVCGLFTAPQPTGALWFHLDYLDEGLQAQNSPESGNAGTVFAKCASAAAVPGICKAIDDRFASSENPTRTQTEEAFAQMFADMLGNIQGLIQSISLAVIFALTLVAGNAMAMSMRERTTEIAVLKAIGFSRLRVLAMILGEAFLIALVGGLLGVVLGCGLLQLMHGAFPQFIPLGVQDMAGPWMVSAVLIGGFIGLVSGLVPAIGAARLSVIDGLRRVV